MRKKVLDSLVGPGASKIDKLKENEFKDCTVMRNPCCAKAFRLLKNSINN